MPLSPSEVLDAIVKNYDLKPVYTRIDNHLVRQALSGFSFNEFRISLVPSTPESIVQVIVNTYKEKGWRRVEVTQTTDPNDGNSLTLVLVP
jgi:hypothetical protein